jgi:hypothetical protein
VANADLPMTIKVYDASGNFISWFPDFVNLQVIDCINDIPAFTLEWALNAQGGLNLISDSDIQIAVLMDFRDGNGYTEVARFLYEQDTYDPSMNESAVVQANGRGTIALLDQAIVYPQGGVGNTTTSWSFTGASPGKILHDLITAAKGRGCFPGLNMSFTSGADSSGNAWTQAYTYAYNAGTSLLTVAIGLAQAGLCDINMSGLTLNVYNAGTTLATDRSTSVFLRRSREITQMPAQRDRTQIGTVMLAIGDNGVNVERTASTYGTLGRREKYLAQSGVTDTATLDFWADQTLGAIDDQQIAYTPGCVVDTSRGSPVPWKDYHPGDYLGLDVSGTALKYRARQWVVQCSTGGPVAVQPTLNDVFYDLNVLLQGKVTGLSGGSVTGGPATIVNLPGPNATVPNPPAFVPANIYTGAYYSTATGVTLAQIELNWTTPTNTDGTPVNDGQSYIVQYKLAKTPIYPILWSQLQGKPWSSINGNPWSNPLATPQNLQWTTVTVPFDNNNVIIAGLICGETYDFQIATTDVSGNTSLFSSVSPFATARDNVAPSTPDAPTVAASMVAVQVQHDLGRATGGTYNLEQDLDHLEVHYSYDPAFTAVPGVGSTTYLGKLIANAGMMSGNIAAVGTFHVTSTTNIYVRVIAVDESGNSSQASASSGVTVVLIDDTHISSLSVSKLLAGTVMATIILGSTISTAVSGGRVVMNGTSDQFEVYDNSGNNIGIWNPGGWQVFNGGLAGSVKLASASTGLTPVYFFDTGSGNSTTGLISFNQGTIYSISLGPSSRDQLVFSGPTTTNDPGKSSMNFSVSGGTNTNQDDAFTNLTFGSITAGRSYTPMRWDKTGVSITQPLSGQLAPATNPTFYSGSVVQNDDLGTGINPRFLHMGSYSGTTDGSGLMTYNHSCFFTPTGYLICSTTSAFTQYDLHTPGATTCTFGARNGTGVLQANTFISWFAIHWA